VGDGRHNLHVHDKIQAGNLMLGSALLLSGNSYTKVGLMFNFCNILYFSSTLFNQYQQLYIAPAINEFWEQHKQQLGKKGLLKKLF
jgi:hypothetical protein